MATLPLEIFDPANISSPFGWRTMSGQREMHNGVDYPCPVGTPVLAYADGTVHVSKIQNGGGGLGEYVTLKHGTTYSLYAHLSERKVKAGQKVKAGEIIAYSGNTGRSTGPHLHFGLCKSYVAASVSKSKWYDPLPVLKSIITEGEKNGLRTLKKGCRGNDVKYLQYLLRIDADGIFGDITYKAVCDYQRNHGLEVDGKVGPQTRRALGFDGYMVRVFSKQENIWFAGTPYDTNPKPLRSLAQWAAVEGADMVWNLALFNFDDHETVNYVKAKDYEVGYGGVKERIAINWKNVCGGSKVGIKNGKRAGGSISGKRTRNAVGMLNDGRIFIVQSLYSVTEYALVSYVLKNYDANMLLFEDGGGSTGFWDNKRRVLIAPEQDYRDSGGRKVATTLCFKG